jgi:hypothetical protein
MRDDRSAAVVAILAEISLGIKGSSWRSATAGSIDPVSRAR